MDGTLVGINTAIYSRSGGSNGIGFAIPANAVKRFVAGAKAGKLARTWIGVSGQAVTPDIARATGLDRPTGVLVNRVTEGSPADRAGIRVGDVIYAINGHDAFDPGALKYLISTETPGETVKVTLLRKGEARNVDVRLTAPPETPPRNTTTLTGDNILAGVTIANLSPALVAELGSDLPERGVVVMRVDGRAPAARLGFLRPGDIIEAVNGSKVSTVGDVKSRISGSSREASIRINRGGQIGECYFRAPATFQCRS
jgi:serine protease Do